MQTNLTGTFMSSVTNPTISTPGPWRRGQDGNMRVYGPDGQGEHSGLIATVHRGSCMNVIVAAPELLEACELVIGTLKFDREDEFSKEVIRRLNAAIRKAKG
jgi:hypothetical protein